MKLCNRIHICVTFQARWKVACAQNNFQLTQSFQHHRFAGFLVGASLTGFTAYYTLFEHYRDANTAQVAQVEALTTRIQRLQGQVKELESRLAK